MAAVAASVIITAMRYELKDTAEDNYTDDELVGYIDEGQRMFVKTDPKTSPIWLQAAQTATATTGITANTCAYSLPATFWLPIAVTVTDEQGEVHPYPRLTAYNFHGQQQTGYTLTATQIALHPIPPTSVANGLNLYWCPEPTRVSGTAVSVVWSDYFMHEIRAWAVMLAKLRQEEDANSFLTRAMVLRGISPQTAEG